MNDLIKRLEAATEGSREIDARIWCLVNNYEFIYMCDGRGLHSNNVSREIEGYLKFSHKNGQIYEGDKVQYFSLQLRYTTSLDAALTLVPEGLLWDVESRGAAFVGDPKMPSRMFEMAATPTLALCIAALKARESDCK